MVFYVSGYLWILWLSFSCRNLYECLEDRIHQIFYSCYNVIFQTNERVYIPILLCYKYMMVFSVLKDIL